MMMSAPPVTDTNVPRTIGYGLGLRRMLTRTGAETYGHTGTIPGYTALLEHDQELGVTLAVLANRSALDLGEVADSIWQILAAEAAHSAAGK
jgi:D-alanyl-D-alanine carboxypeptidase